MKLMRYIICLVLVSATLTARAACLENGVPPVDLPVENQKTFWADVLFEAEFKECTADELTTIQTLLSDNLKRLLIEYQLNRAGRTPELITLAAAVKSSLMAVRFAKVRKGLE